MKTKLKPGDVVVIEQTDMYYLIGIIRTKITPIHYFVECLFNDYEALFYLEQITKIGEL